MATTLSSMSSVARLVPKFIVRARHDYHSNSPLVLSFKTGDFFMVLDDSPKFSNALERISPERMWYEVADPSRNLKGFVPKDLFDSVERKGTSKHQEMFENNNLSKNNKLPSPTFSKNQINTETTEQRRFISSSRLRSRVQSSDAGYISSKARNDELGSSNTSTAQRKSEGLSSQEKTNLTTLSKEKKEIPDSKVTNDSQNIGELHAYALYDFQPQRADELTALRGDKIHVLAYSSGMSWIVGQPINESKNYLSKKQPGLLPLSYVKMYNEATRKRYADPPEALRIHKIPTLDEWKNKNKHSKSSNDENSFSNNSRLGDESQSRKNVSQIHYNHPIDLISKMEIVSNSTTKLPYSMVSKTKETIAKQNPIEKINICEGESESESFLKKLDNQVLKKSSFSSVRIPKIITHDETLLDEDFKKSKIKNEMSPPSALASLHIGKNNKKSAANDDKINNNNNAPFTYKINSEIQKDLNIEILPNVINELNKIGKSSSELKSSELIYVPLKSTNSQINLPIKKDFTKERIAINEKICPPNHIPLKEIISSPPNLSQTTEKESNENEVMMKKIKIKIIHPDGTFSMRCPADDFNLNNIKEMVADKLFNGEINDLRELLWRRAPADLVPMLNNSITEEALEAAINSELYRIVIYISH